MRKTALVLLGMMLVAAVVFAAEPAVTWKTKTVTFNSDVKVGAEILPAGDYKVQHEMDGAKHVMIFTLKGKEAKSFRVTCGMQAREEKARRDEQHFKNENNQKVLTGLIFAGDNVIHTF